MLCVHDTTLVLIDMQHRLAAVMADRESLVSELQRLIRGALVLGLPVVWTEQNPDKLGPTIAELKSLLMDNPPIPKMAFNCWLDERFRDAIERAGRRQVLIAGIETHVCVYQTARALHEVGYEVEVVADAVSSRSLQHKELALRKLTALGIHITCVEMALFEMLGTAQAVGFKEILALVK
ncbi:MAG: hydrolase [Verrucomicrobiota bacterium]|nr:hydrolase [Limisphaera sp.]MDW8380683.1 hydrolase [Verrucomicrobiota bacterium]